MLHSRWPSLNSAADTYVLTRLSLSLIAVSDRIPRLLAITIYAKAVAQKLGQAHRETSQPSFPPPPLLSGLYSDCISSEGVQCVSFCCHKQLLDPEAFKSISNVLTIWNFTMLVTTTSIYKD